MKKFALTTLLALVAAGAIAENPHGLPPGIAKKLHAAQARAPLCDDCGTVQEVRHEKRKGEGGAVGIVAGAAAGGLLGNQVGSGNGKTLATVGGAVAGGFVGNEVQKRVTAREVWITQVKMKDGSLRTFENTAQPEWKTGGIVRVHQGRSLVAVGS
jgi:outer membrane lipoprotein SlyB